MATPGVVITVYNEARAGWRERTARKCPGCGYEAFEDGWSAKWLCPKCNEPWQLVKEKGEKEPRNLGRTERQFEDALSEKHKGNELLATLDSVRSHSDNVPIVVVDDGSDDGCCDRVGEFGAKLVKNDKRIGIGYSRSHGVRELDPGCDTVMFLDAHQRVSDSCIDFCSDLALEHDAIVWPDTRGLRDRPRHSRLKKGRKSETWTGHGATPRCKPQKDEDGYLFRYSWINEKPIDKLSRTHAMISPGYTVPRTVWDKMPISSLTRGFGGNEPMLWVKAFFLDVPILHTCKAMVRHLFRAHTAHYTSSMREVYRNMSILAKTCFDAETWYGWWWPEVFSGVVSKHTAKVLDSSELNEEHIRFQTHKQRPDSEFFRGLCLEGLPVDWIK